MNTLKLKKKIVHLYGLHVYCALVDLGSSGSPGVRPTPGLTSSTQHT